ncbi:MAG: DNA primase [Armatimonadota bacterium]|jgi:DNA primase
MDFDEAKEEIRDRLDIIEVIGQHVRLERSGQRFKGLCPFHQEKTPSFTVDPERGFYHCFGCGEGGDIFSFVMKRDGLSFPEALRQLARRAGVQIESDPMAGERRRRRELLERANEIARDHFRRNLFKHPSAEQARRYIAGRGFSRAMIDRFQLGFALDSWDDLLNALAAEGINATLAEEAGLAKRGERGGHYDTFRNRIIFPIMDMSGRVIGFGGRAMDPENPAKYLNSPETPLFHKRRAVYALDVARDAVVTEKRALIVEGYTDVISLHQAGIGNAVAGLGTALTGQQLELLGRYADEVVLVYDSDAAGARAALNNLEVVETAEIAASLVVLPENTDPDEFVREHGPDAFRELLDDRVSPIEYQLRMIFDRHADRGPDGAADAARETVDVLMRIDDWPRRDEFIARAADMWGQGDPGRTESMTRVLKFELSRKMKGERTSTSRGPSERDPGFIAETLTRTRADLMKAETELLALALDDAETAFAVVARLEPEDMLLEADAAILRALQEQIASSGSPDPNALADELPEEEGVRHRCVELTVAQIERTEREDDDVRAAQTAEAIGRLRAHRRLGGIGWLVACNLSDDDEIRVEDFQQLQRMVVQGIESGELTPDDPIVVQYYEVCRRVRGSSGRGFVGDAQLRERSRTTAPEEWKGRTDEELAALERSSAAASGSAADEDSGANVKQEPARPPVGDPFAVEEGDPFTDDDD